MRLPVLPDRVHSPTRCRHGKHASKCQQSVRAQCLDGRRPNWHLQVSAPKNGWKEQCQWHRRESTDKGNEVLEEWDSIGHWSRVWKEVDEILVCFIFMFVIDSSVRKGIHITSYLYKQQSP